MNIRRFKSVDESAAIAFWQRCGLDGSRNDPVRDIALKSSWQPELFFVGELNGLVVGTVMAGYEGHRGWINYLAVDPDARRRGVGRALMLAAEDAFHALGCPKINLQVRSTNSAVVAFDRQLGYAVDEVVSLGKHL